MRCPAEIWPVRLAGVRLVGAWRQALRAPRRNVRQRTHGHWLRHQIRRMAPVEMKADFADARVRIPARPDGKNLYAGRLETERSRP